MIRILNRKHDDCRGAVYVGRGSALGNPFRLKSAGGAYTRAESIAAYRDWLRRQIEAGTPAVVTELNRLFALARDGDLSLACFCAPESCHADVIAEVLQEALSRRLDWPRGRSSVS